MPKHSIDSASRGSHRPSSSLNSDMAKPGSIRYLDGSALERPLSLPRKFWPMLLAIVALGVIFGFMGAQRFNHNVVHRAERTQEGVTSQINRGVSQDLPALSSFAGMDDEAILQSFVDEGYVYVDMNEINGSSEASLDVIKLPSDMSITEAALAYTEGVSHLNSETAAKFLSGSWRMMVVRDSAASFSVKYADFESNDSAQAVQRAVVTQGFSESDLGDITVDEAGNTNQNGTIEIDGQTYSWSISACDLSEVYKIQGMPDNAQYVGVRLNG